MSASVQQLPPLLLVFSSPCIWLVPVLRVCPAFEMGACQFRVRLVPLIPWSSQNEHGCFSQVLSWCHFLSVHPSMRLVPFSLVTSVYPAYPACQTKVTLFACHFKLLLFLLEFTPLTGEVFSISCLSSSSCLLVCGDLSHHSVPSFAN